MYQSADRSRLYGVKGSRVGAAADTRAREGYARSAAGCCPGPTPGMASDSGEVADRPACVAAQRRGKRGLSVVAAPTIL